MAKTANRYPRTIEIRVRAGLLIADGQLKRNELKAIKDAFTHSNPAYYAKQRLGLSVWGTDSKIKHYRKTEGGTEFPRGGTQSVRNVCADLGITCRFLDERVEFDPEPIRILPQAEPISLRPHQQYLVAQIVERQNILIRAAPGSGKTEVALAAAEATQQPMLVVVWTDNLYSQWQQRIRKRWGWPAQHIGQLGGGIKRIHRVTIAMAQTLAKHPHYLDLFGLVVCDEVQAYGAKTYLETISRAPGKYRVGLSADERRKDKLDFLIRNTFGEVAANVHRDELIARGDLCAVKIYLHIRDTHIPELDGIDEPSARTMVLVEKYNAIMDRLANDEARNALITRIAAEEISHGSPTMIFCNRIKSGHAEHLRATMLDKYGIPTGLMVGGASNKRAFADARREILSGGIDCVVASSAVYQGEDIPRLIAGVVATPVGNNEQLIEQMIGRLRRPYRGKTFGRLHYVLDAQLAPHMRRLFIQWYGAEHVEIIEA